MRQGPVDMPGGRPRRARFFALVLAALVTAGCFTGTAPSGEAGPAPGPDPALACPSPCAVAIDSGIRWEPAVAVNPQDPRHLVASSQDQARAAGRVPTSWGLSHVSLDGGLTWRTVRLPGGPGGDPLHPLSQYRFMDDSTPAFLPDGTLLWGATMDGASGRGASVVVLRSLDGGLTFPEMAVVGQGTGAAAGPAAVVQEFHDKQWFAVAPDGTALLVWNVNYRGHTECDAAFSLQECSRVLFSVSRDSGRTWTRPGVIHEDGVFSGAFPLIRADGGWVVSFRDSADRTVRVAISTDEGKTWNVSDAIDATTKFPVLAATRGPSGAERLYMAYPMSEENHDGAQVVTLRWSDDGGATWSPPFPLAEPQHDGRTNPAIAPAAGGGVLVTYFHPDKDGATYRAVHFRDGRVSEPLTLGTHDGGPEGATRSTGDYMGIAPLPDGSAYAVWNARSGDAFTVTGARLAAV